MAPPFQNPEIAKAVSHRMPVIDLVRFWSIFIVVGGHFFPRWMLSAVYPELLKSILLRLFLNAPYGVTCFFFVSGFLITGILAGPRGNFSKMKLKDFYIRRAARIFPLLALIVLVGLWFSRFPFPAGDQLKKYDVWKLDPGMGWAFWPSLLTFTFNWFLILRDQTLQVGAHWAILWSLAVEEQFYFLYPLVTKALERPKKICWFLSGVVLSGILFRVGVFWVKGDDVNWGATASFAAFDQIAVGGLFYFLWKVSGQGLKNNSGQAWSFVFLGLSIMGAIFGLTSNDNGAQRVLAPTLLALGCGLFVFGGLALPVFTQTFWRFVSWPGKLSYGCYLWHQSLIFILMPLLAWLGGLPAFFFLLAAVIAFSFLSYWWFEQPLNLKIRTFFKDGSSKAPLSFKF